MDHLRIVNAKFVCDVHLGRLARYLRMLGFDSLWSAEFEDDELLRISREEGRYLLTRDRELCGRAGKPACHYVKATDPKEQIIEVIAAFALKEQVASGKGFLTLCMDCNAPILPTQPHQVVDRLPGSVLLAHDKFFLCPRCERIFWQGSHWDRMKEWVNSQLKS